MKDTIPRCCKDCGREMISARRYRALPKEERDALQAEGKVRATTARQCNGCYLKDFKKKCVETIPRVLSDEEVESLRRMNREWWIKEAVPRMQNLPLIFDYEEAG